MRRILRGSAWNRARIDKRMREVFRMLCRIEKRHGFERFEPDAGGIGITRSGFGDDRCLVLNVQDNIENFDRKLAFSELDWLWA